MHSQYLIFVFFIFTHFKFYTICLYDVDAYFLLPHFPVIRYPRGSRINPWSYNIHGQIVQDAVVQDKAGRPLTGAVRLACFPDWPDQEPASIWTASQPTKRQASRGWALASQDC